MKKIISGGSFVLAILSATVALYPNEVVHIWAKRVLVITGVIFIFSVLFLCFEKYLFIKDMIKKVRKTLYSINIIAENLKNIDQITDLMNFKRTISQLNKSVDDMIKRAEIFAQTCNTTRQKVEGCQENIIAQLNDKSNFQYHTTDVTSQLKNLLDANKEIDEIRIICFGRSGYGDIVQHIEEKELPIKIKIIICNPEKNKFICNENDSRKINELIDMMLRIKADIYLADIPPAIRASTVYIKGEAIWSATQSYQFRRVSDKKIELTRPKESLIVTCNEYNSKRDFYGIVKCFQSEYDRLLEKYLIPVKDNNGKIDYIEDNKKMII